MPIEFSVMLFTRFAAFFLVAIVLTYVFLRLYQKFGQSNNINKFQKNFERDSEERKELQNQLLGTSDPELFRAYVQLTDQQLNNMAREIEELRSFKKSTEDRHFRIDFIRLTPLVMILIGAVLYFLKV